MISSKVESSLNCTSIKWDTHFHQLFCSKRLIHSKKVCKKVFVYQIYSQITTQIWKQIYIAFLCLQNDIIKSQKVTQFCFCYLWLRIDKFIKYFFINFIIFYKIKNETTPLP